MKGDRNKMGYACKLNNSEHMRETVLWTNSKPTTAIGGDTIKLSESYYNFKYLGVYIRQSSSTANYYWVYIATRDISTTGYKRSGSSYIWFGVGNGGYPRPIYIGYSTDTAHTTIVIGNTYRAGDSGTSNATSIPQKISGFNVLT